MGDDRTNFWECLRRAATLAIDHLERAAETDEAFAEALSALWPTVQAPPSSVPDSPASPAGENEQANEQANDQRDTPDPQVERRKQTLKLGDVSAEVPAVVEPGWTPSPMPAPLPVDSQQHDPESYASAHGMGEGFDFSRVAARCRLKAEATRWQVERARRLEEGQDVWDDDDRLRARANEAGCSLWMLSPTQWVNRTDQSVETIAGCYATLAEASELMALADAEGRDAEMALRLLAEAQSALRAALIRNSNVSRDRDQDDVFHWLRHETQVRRVFCDSMQLDSPADPEAHAGRRARIRTERTAIEARMNRRRSLTNLFRRLETAIQALVDRFPPPETMGEPPAFGPHHPRTIEASNTVKALRQAGVAPSDERLREIFVPVISRMPAGVSPELDAVLDEVEQHLERRQAAVEEAESREDDSDRFARDADVQAARETIAERCAVLIGGQPREERRLALQQALGFARLEWVRISHGEPFDNAAAAIRRDNVGLVLIMTRWRSHRDGPAAREICRERRIPLVELPGGYSVRQVATAILNQAGHRLDSSNDAA